MVASIVFLTPTAAFVALAAVLPLAALVLAGRRVRAARALLRLPPPPPSRLLPKVLALAAVPMLLGVAAAEPALRTQTSSRVRTDAQAMFVIDISRSMLAAKSPTAATRLMRAQQEAIAIRNALPEIPSGVATFTDRVLPALLPNSDPAVFDDTVTHAVAIEQPPPSDVNVIATDLGNLNVLGTGDYFAPSVRKRLVVVLTDGESRPFDPVKLAHALATGPGIHLVLVHVWATGEQVYDGSTPESAYHEDPTSGSALDSLAAATNGTAVGENQIGRAVRAAQADLGTGPTIVTGRTERTRTLAPYVALLALLPLLLLARGDAWRRIGAAAGLLVRSRPSLRLRPGLRPATGTERRSL
jgi:hypothetical protein